MKPLHFDEVVAFRIGLGDELPMILHRDFTGKIIAFHSALVSPQANGITCGHCTVGTRVHMGDRVAILHEASD